MFWRIALVTDQPLYREGMQLAFGEAGSLILLEGATIADAAQPVKSRLADIIVIEANSIPQAVAMANALASCPATVPIGDAAQPVVWGTEIHAADAATTAADPGTHQQGRQGRGE